MPRTPAGADEKEINTAERPIDNRAVDGALCFSSAQVSAEYIIDDGVDRIVKDVDIAPRDILSILHHIDGGRNRIHLCRRFAAVVIRAVERSIFIGVFVRRHLAHLRHCLIVLIVGDIGSDMERRCIRGILHKAVVARHSVAVRAARCMIRAVDGIVADAQARIRGVIVDRSREHLTLQNRRNVVMAEVRPGRRSRVA